MSITRTCALAGCEVTFETYPADDQRHCSISHGMRAGRPAYRDSAAALRTCAYNGCKATFRARTPSDPKSFCSRPCAYASRRQDTCTKCSGDDWIVRASGKRACRPCRNRHSAATRKPVQRRTVAGRRVLVTPPPVATSALPLPPPRPVWRPTAPGWSR